MAYYIKEIFYSLQGEGFWAGRPAIFCRFTGCNLWSGMEADRATAQCTFCDTDFVGTNGINGGIFKSVENLVTAITRCDPTHRQHTTVKLTMPVAHTKVTKPEKPAKPVKPVKPMILFTGGEPCMQLKQELIDALHALGYFIAMETNGTLPLPCPIDWVCVSPKANTTLAQISGNELKLVYPHTDASGNVLAPQTYEQLDFTHFFIQPCAQNEQNNTNNLQTCITFCLNNPLWRLSIQQHKYLGIL